MTSTSPRQRKDRLILQIGKIRIGFAPARVWCPSPTYQHRTAPYPVPQKIVLGMGHTATASSRFSPSPYAVIVEEGGRRCFVGVKATKGWHRWNTVSFAASRHGVRVEVDLEGHTSPSQAARHIQAITLPGQPGEAPHALLRRGMERVWPSAFRQPKKRLPAWWSKPIYCGWGDQVGLSLDLEGPGDEFRALAYCTQGLYERWIARLETANVPIGTIIIDAGWSPAGTLSPDLGRWPDLRGFIARQHARKRRVLLWVGTWMCEGLPDAWCLFAGKRKLVANPEHPAYRAFLRRQVTTLLSPRHGGFDADGFKLDQLSLVPNERCLSGAEQCGRGFVLGARHAPIRPRTKRWGCELLHLLQSDIYRAAKDAKSDALVTSSTVHPYFHDTFDMVRLHDTGDVRTDVFLAMKARADLAKAALPHHPLDTDDWITENYGKWLRYTLRSRELGVPCLFYAERFVRAFESAPTVTPIPLGDLQRIARRWKGGKAPGNRT